MLPTTSRIDDVARIIRDAPLSNLTREVETAPRSEFNINNPLLIDLPDQIPTSISYSAHGASGVVKLTEHRFYNSARPIPSSVWSGTFNDEQLLPFDACLLAGNFERRRMSEKTRLEAEAARIIKDSQFPTDPRFWARVNPGDLVRNSLGELCRYDQAARDSWLLGFGSRKSMMESRPAKSLSDNPNFSVLRCVVPQAELQLVIRKRPDFNSSVMGRECKLLTVIDAGVVAGTHLTEGSKADEVFSRISGGNLENIHASHSSINERLRTRMCVDSIAIRLGGDPRSPSQTIKHDEWAVVVKLGDPIRYVFPSKVKADDFADYLTEQKFEAFVAAWPHLG